jgi:hypothetical protein
VSAGKLPARRWLCYYPRAIEGIHGRAGAYNSQIHLGNVSVLQYLIFMAEMSGINFDDTF